MSISVSPLVTLEVAVAIDSVSALRRFSAISNEVRVRVLGSKNRLTTVRPRSAGTFLIGRVPISFIASAVSRISEISEASSPAMPSRCRLLRRWTPAGAGVSLTGVSTSCFYLRGPWQLGGLEDDLVGAVDFQQPDLHALFE